MTPPLSDRTDRGKRTSPITRRRLLATVTGGLALSQLSATSGVSTVGTTNQNRQDRTVRIRVYPIAPAGIDRKITELSGFSGGWEEPTNAAFSAIREAIDQIERYAIDEGRLDSVTFDVEAASPITLPGMTATADSPLRSQQSLLDAFHEAIHDRETDTYLTSHVLLWWNPFQHRVGYGGTRSPNSHIARYPDLGADTVANVGATEFWDTRAVTRNIAVHEMLHTLVSSSVVSQIILSRCDHNLGELTRPNDSTAVVSPMATAYAGPDGLGGGTRWPGSGCSNHALFHRHDGYDGVERWEYTSTLSNATLDAVTTYLEQNVK